MLLKNFIKKISENISFFILVFADFRKLFLIYFLEMSGMKVFSLIFLTYFFLQIFILLQKAFYDYNLLFSLQSFSSLFFAFLIFPFLYALEKFHHTDYIFDKYEGQNSLNENSFYKALQRLKDYKNPIKLFSVYLFSQTKFFLDFSLLFIFLFLIFSKNLLNSNLYFAIIFLSLSLFFLNIKFWRGSIFLFLFWREKVSLKNAFKQSLNFTSSKKIEILIKYILIRISQFLLLTFLPFLLYTKKLHLLFFEYLNNFFSPIFAFYFVVFLIIFLALCLYTTILLLEFIFWNRIYFDLNGENPKVINNNLSFSKRILFGMFILISSFFIIFFLSYKTIIINFDNLFKNLNSINYQKLISISDDPSNISTKLYLQNSISKGENAIAVQGFFENNNFFIKPLYSFPDTFLLNEIFSVSPIFSFDNYQFLQRKIYSEGKISFYDAYNTITSAGRSVFLYIPKQKITDENFSILEKDLEKANSYFLVIFSSDEEILNRLKLKFPNFRYGLLSTVAINENYSYKTFFTFSNFISLNSDLNLLKNEVKIYSIYKKNESISNQVDLENVHGILSNQTLSFYNSLREKKEKDYYLKYLSAPLTFFGF